MRILCVCAHGNNRSVQFAHLLKYWGHDTIAIGLDTTTEETLEMLFKWADHIILTEAGQLIPDDYRSKVHMWNVGPDTYPRPFNPELHAKAKEFLEDNKSWLKT